ncbi:MAG: DUF2062 domain-containing protein [Anaerolineaceae bacterium]|nr:MAG: DUF2062 domain-containing protein [Anaerolineaceae bacterium]
MLIQRQSNISFLVREAAAFLRRQLRRELKELCNPAVPPARLAMAFAVGTLLSFIPLPVLDSLLVSLVLVRFRQLNKASLVAARLVWNDLVVLSLAPTSYRLGVSILPETLIASADPVPASKLIMLVLNVAIGNLLIAVAATIGCYMLVWLGMIVVRRWVPTTAVKFGSYHYAVTARFGKDAGTDPNPNEPHY